MDINRELFLLKRGGSWTDHAPQIREIARKERNHRCVSCRHEFCAANDDPTAKCPRCFTEVVTTNGGALVSHASTPPSYWTADDGETRIGVFPVRGGHQCWIYHRNNPLFKSEVFTTEADAKAWAADTLSALRTIKPDESLT